MHDYLLALAILLPHAGLILIGYGISRAAGRWPLGVAAGLIAAIALGCAGIWIGADCGCALPTPDTRHLDHGPLPGRICMSAGALLVLLGFPALLFVPDAKARLVRGDSIGPLLGVYWFSCMIFSMVLYSWLTGWVK